MTNRFLLSLFLVLRSGSIDSTCVQQPHRYACFCIQLISLTGMAFGYPTVSQSLSRLANHCVRARSNCESPFAEPLESAGKQSSIVMILYWSVLLIFKLIVTQYTD